MLKQHSPSNVIHVPRPLRMRGGGIPGGLDLSDDRRRGRRDIAVQLDAPVDASRPADLSAESDSSTGWWSAVLPFVMEGFALYGAALHPNAMFLLDAMPRAASVGPPRSAGGQPQAHTFEQETALPDLRQHHWSWWAALGETVAELLMHWRRERDIRGAVAALNKYDDRTLRDLGINGRADIERAVRYCRDC